MSISWCQKALLNNKIFATKFFNMGLIPLPPLNNVKKKTALLAKGGFPNSMFYESTFNVCGKQKCFYLVNFCCERNVVICELSPGHLNNITIVIVINNIQ